jgi:hypothetical protein
MPHTLWAIEQGERTMRTLAIVIGALALAGCNQNPANEAPPANDTAANEVVATEAAIPDMKGKWSGKSESLVTGMSRYHEAPERGDRLLDNVDYTYTIEGQDGHRFWGTLSSPTFEEEVTGVVAKDGKTIVARTSEGEVRGTMIDADTIDITYSAGGRDMTVVAVNTWKRTRP